MSTVGAIQLTKLVRLFHGRLNIELCGFALHAEFTGISKGGFRLRLILPENSRTTKRRIIERGRFRAETARGEGSSFTVITGHPFPTRFNDIVYPSGINRYLIKRSIEFTEYVVTSVGTK